MNERTRFFIKIYLTPYPRKGCERVDVGYVWEVSWRRRQTVTCWPKVLLATIAALLPHLGSLRAQALCLELVPTLQASYLQLRLELNSNCNCHSNSLPWTDSLKLSVAPGYIIVWHPPASFGRTHLHRIQPRPQVNVIFRYLRPVVSPPFRLFTQVHPLIDGSGQYVTTVQQRYGDTLTF